MYENPELEAVSLVILQNILKSNIEFSSNSQVLCIAEEAGEVVKAWARYSGQARRAGTFDAVCEELADLVITCYVAAEHFKIDLASQIDYKLNKVTARGGF